MGTCSSTLQYKDQDLLKIDINQDGVDLELLFVSANRKKLSKKQKKILDSKISDYIDVKYAPPVLVRQNAISELK